MKQLGLFAAALAVVCAGAAAQAGSLSDPVVETPVIIDDAEGSSSGTALVALLAVLLAVPALGD